MDSSSKVHGNGIGECASQKKNFSTSWFKPNSRACKYFNPKINKLRPNWHLATVSAKNIHHTFIVTRNYRHMSKDYL